MDEIGAATRMVQTAFAPKLTKFRVQSGDTTSFVEVGTSPLTLLLGRNGNGKTLLLNSLKRWGEQLDSPVKSYPIFRLPTPAEMTSWRETVETYKDAQWVKELVLQVLWIPGEEIDEQTPNYQHILDDELSGMSLPLLHSISGCLAYRSTTVHPYLGNMTDDQVLEWFKFSDTAILHWKQRHEMYLRNFDQQLQADHEYPFDWLWNSDVRTYSCDYFLNYINSHAPDTSTDHRLGMFNDVIPAWGRWIEDSHLAELVGPAIEEFFASLEEVEFSNPSTFRLLGRPPESGCYASFRTAIDNFIRSAEEAFPADSHPRQFDNRPEPGFPASCLHPSHSVGQVTTIPITGTVDLVGNSISIIDLTPYADSDDFVGRVKRNLFKLVDVSKNAKAENDFEVKLTGFTKLNKLADDVSFMLETSDLNISAVRVSPVKINPFGGPNSYWGGESPTEEQKSEEFGLFGLRLDLEDELADSFPLPEIHIFDQNRGEWCVLEEGSTGQQQVIGTLLLLSVVRELAAHEYGQVLILADEIDSRLHWSAGTALLSSISSVLASMDTASGIVSTHSVPSISRPELASCSVVFAEREQSVFRYQNGRDLDLSLLTSLLGTDPLDSLRLARLIVLVEGQHDEDIIRHIVLGLVPDPTQVVIVNARGIYAWAGLMTNLLRHSEVPILLVHDKRDMRLEEEWAKFTRDYNRGDAYGDWRTSSFSRMKADLSAKETREPGDDELDKILSTIEDAVFEGDRSLAARMSIFGFEANDVVDLLPIGNFFKTGVSRPANWDEAWTKFRTGRKLKMAAGITAESVRKSAMENTKNPHPELRRLAKTVTRLLGQF